MELEFKPNHVARNPTNLYHFDQENFIKKNIKKNKKSKIEREKHLLIPLVTDQVHTGNLIKFSFDMGLINQHV